MPSLVQYEAYFGRLCTVSTIVRPILRHKSLTDGPTGGSWTKFLSFGTTRILAVFEYVPRVLSVSRCSACFTLAVSFAVRLLSFRFTLDRTFRCELGKSKQSSYAANLRYIVCIVEIRANGETNCSFLWFGAAKRRAGRAALRVGPKRASQG